MTTDLQTPPGPIVLTPVNGSCADDAASPPERSAATLMSGIIADAQQLIQQQFTMIRQEIQADLRKTKEAARSLVVGVGISLASSAMLLLALPLLLHWARPELPLWACLILVGGVLAVPGWALVYAGIKKFDTVSPLSDQSAASMKENLQWTTTPK